jgi:hypothetical protein
MHRGAHEESPARGSSACFQWPCSCVDVRAMRLQVWTGGAHALRVAPQSRFGAPLLLPVAYCYWLLAKHCHANKARGGNAIAFEQRHDSLLVGWGQGQHGPLCCRLRRMPVLPPATATHCITRTCVSKSCLALAPGLGFPAPPPPPPFPRRPARPPDGLCKHRPRTQLGQVQPGGHAPGCSANLGVCPVRSAS